MVPSFLCIYSGKNAFRLASDLSILFSDEMEYLEKPKLYFRLLKHMIS